MTVKANLIHREVESLKAYEAVFIFDPALSEDQANELKEKVSSIITQQNGVLHEIRYWGKRRFAYLMDKKREGHYFLFIFDADETVPEQLNHFARVTETVLRNMIIKRTPPSRRRNKKQEQKAKSMPMAHEAPVAPIETIREPEIPLTEELNLAVDTEIEEGVVNDA
jgi:small subunit ribosomal protein S6